LLARYATDILSKVADLLAHRFDRLGGLAPCGRAGCFSVSFTGSCHLNALIVTSTSRHTLGGVMNNGRASRMFRRIAKSCECGSASRSSS
jgi:hypothetical protein